MIYRNPAFGNDHNLLSPSDERAIPYGHTGVLGPQPPVAGQTFCATCIGPRLVVVPAHLGYGPGTNFLYQGANYTVVKRTVSTLCDAAYLELDRNVLNWTKRWRGQVLQENVTPVFFVGHGLGRGAAYMESGVQMGWYVGGLETWAKRWGQYRLFYYKPEPTPGTFPNCGWRWEDPSSENASLTSGDSGGSTFVQVNGEWLFIGPATGGGGGQNVGEVVRFDYPWAGSSALILKDESWIDAQNAQWLPSIPDNQVQAQAAGYQFITPGLDPTLLPQVSEECGLARWISASQIKQMVEMARPGENIGFVWVSSEAPPVAEDPAFKNFIWIDISTTWPYSNREYNHATGSWDIVVPRPGSFTGEVFKDGSISLTKLLPPGPSNARKVLSANSNGTAYVWMFGKDTIGEKELSLSKLLVPDSAQVGSYLTVVSKGTLGFSTLDSGKILSLIPDGSLGLAKLATAPGAVRQLLGIDETDPKKWKFYDPASGGGGNDPRILYTPSGSDPADDFKILAVKDGTAGYDAYTLNFLLQQSQVPVWRRWYYRGLRQEDIDALPEAEREKHYNYDELFVTGSAGAVANIRKWKHGLGEMPKRWFVYARCARNIIYPGDGAAPPEPPMGDPRYFREDQMIDVNLIRSKVYETDIGSASQRYDRDTAAYVVYCDADFIYIRGASGHIPQMPIDLFEDASSSSDIGSGLDLQNSWYESFVFDLIVEA